MFKSIITAVSIALVSTPASSEVFTVNRTLTCDDLKIVVELLKKYGERVVWQSHSDKGLFNILTLNNETQTWSIVITNGQSACLVDSGKGYVMKSEPQKDSPKEAPKDGGKGVVNRIIM